MKEASAMYDLKNEEEMKAVVIAGIRATLMTMTATNLPLDTRVTINTVITKS